MLAKRLARMASLVLISISIPSLVSDIELAVGKAREGRVSAGKPQSYVLLLNGEDYAQIKIDHRGKELAVIAYDPSRSRFRGSTLGPDEDRFNFIVDRPGAYRPAVGPYRPRLLSCSIRSTIRLASATASAIAATQAGLLLGTVASFRAAS